MNVSLSVQRLKISCLSFCDAVLTFVNAPFSSSGSIMDSFTAVDQPKKDREATEKGLTLILTRMVSESWIPRCKSYYVMCELFDSS